MEITSNPAADALFSAMTIRQTGLESLANNALSNGINQYTHKDYEGAFKAFKQSIAFSPYSDYAPDAAKYMAMSFQKLGDTSGAIKAYTDAIELNKERDDLYLGLGNLYYSEGKYTDARDAYAKAVDIYPSETNLFSLGQANLSLEKYGEAENQYNQIIRISPDSHSGYYGLGQALSKQGEYEKAIEAFETALSKKIDFYDAYAEIGYAYADMGDIDSAQTILGRLEDLDASLADTLNRYIYKTKAPQFSFVHSESTFQYRLSINNQVASLDSYLANAGTSKTFTMKFQFDKEMDRESVESLYNWSISRSSLGGPGANYNFGLQVPNTENVISPIPEYIFYDPEKLTATVFFSVRQNAGANATIDPSHIKFQFKGTDAYGTAMDPEADEFMGFNGIG